MVWGKFGPAGFLAAPPWVKVTPGGKLGLAWAGAPGAAATLPPLVSLGIVIALPLAED